jgi:hypothetical protein
MTRGGAKASMVRRDDDVTTAARTATRNIMVTMRWANRSL